MNMTFSSETHVKAAWDTIKDNPILIGGQNIRAFLLEAPPTISFRPAPDACEDLGKNLGAIHGGRIAHISRVYFSDSQNVPI